MAGTLRAALAVAAIVLCGAPAVATAAYPGRNGLVAFLGERDVRYDFRGIHLAAGDGSRTWHVGANHGISALRFSPDGRTVVIGGPGGFAHTSHRLVDSPDGPRLPVSGAPALPGTLENGFGLLSWAPGGEQLVARYLGGRPPGQAQEGLYLIDPALAAFAVAWDATSGDPLARRSRWLTASGGLDPVWSPTAARIAHAGCGAWEAAHRCGLWVTEVADGRTTLIVEGRRLTGDDRAVGAPDWSPDGTRIVFHTGAERDVGARVWSARADGTDVRPLPGTGWTPAYSPDGTRIVVADEQGLRQLTSGGTELERLFAEGPAVDPDWQPLVAPAREDPPPPAPPADERPAPPAPPPSSPPPAPAPPVGGSGASTAPLARARLRAPARLRVGARGRLRVALACPSGAAAACRGTLRVTRSGRPLAAARFTVAPGARRTVTLRLRRADRRALRRARGLRVTFTVRGPGPTTRATRRLVAG